MKDDKNNKSHFALGRRSRKRSIMIIIPIVVVIIATVVGLSFMPGAKLPSNQMTLHKHVTLSVYVNGLPLTVPEHIGMVQVGKAEDPLLYADHSLDKYGMQGMSPLHTHDASGTIHVESNTVKDYTLGELLDTWKGLEVNGKTVIASVDGKPVTDFRNIILNDGEKIKLDIKS